MTHPQLPIPTTAHKVPPRNVGDLYVLPDKWRDSGLIILVLTV